MSKIIEAIYENGVFKPLEKVDLKDGEKVKIILGSIVERTFGILKASEEDIERALEELENEWGFLLIRMC
ncbi:MAG: antitoxin family protein [Archaeoglobales archaeon]|nr:antitoxin family protein [Archaeoglobales archaeon]